MFVWDITENRSQRLDGGKAVTVEETSLKLEVKTFSEQHGREVCRWNYEKEYAVYNLPSWKMVKKLAYDISIPEKREKEYYAVCWKGELIGYFRLIQEQNVILAGVGLKPEFCGLGRGIFLVKVMVEQAGRQYPGKRLCLIVRTFNKRAINCYQKAGFLPKGMIEKQISGKTVPFLVMEYKP